VGPRRLHRDASPNLSHVAAINSAGVVALGSVLDASGTRDAVIVDPSPVVRRALECAGLS
jgi:anti-anti-sigma regulatory factor